MADTLKARAIRERIRRKYVRTRNRSNTKEREGRLHINQSEKGMRLKPLQMRIRSRQKLLSEIQKERHPDKLKEKIELAQKQNLKMERLKKEKERLEKMEKARKRLKESIKRMNSREASANTKEAVQEIQAGRSGTAIRQLSSAGRDGALGNDISNESTTFSREAKILAKESGKHFDSIMYKMLKENSVPADTIKSQIRQDKGDQNLEGSKTKDSTTEQMILKKLQDRKMR